MSPAVWEKGWPVLLAVCVVAATATLAVVLDVGPLPVAVPAATMTFGVVVAGFAATQRNMLLTNDRL